jgi:glycosyltransferase involved in cell wall biosynthesis
MVLRSNYLSPSAATRVTVDSDANGERVTPGSRVAEGLRLSPEYHEPTHLRVLGSSHVPAPAVTTRVLHVVEAFATGPLFSVSTIVRSLDDRFHFGLLFGRRPETPEELTSWLPRTTQLYEWPAGRRPSPSDLRAAQRLRQVVREFRPDVIHAHSSKAGALTRTLYGKRGPFVVYSPRGFAFQRRDVGAVARQAFRTAERLLSRANSLTVACGIAELEASIRLRRPAMLIRNAVEHRAPAVRYQDLPATPFTVVSVGGIRPQKNFPLFAEIARACPNIRFVWVGDVAHGCRPEAPDNVEITGWLAHADVLELVGSAHVYLQTSLWEGLSVAVLEALSLSRPILAFPSPGNVEVVVHGYNGALCTRSDAFAQTIERWRAEPERRFWMSANSGALSRAEFGLDAALHRWSWLYEDPRRVRRLCGGAAE